MARKTFIKIIASIAGFILLSFVALMVWIYFLLFGPPPEPSRELVEATALKELPQILLTNTASFKEHTGLQGASSFLVEGPQGRPLFVTARHLIGDAGGVQPEISVLQLDDYLERWEAYPRTRPDKAILVSGVFLRDVDENELDLLVLNVDSQQKISVQALPLRYSPPKISEIVYLLGCEYSDSDCAQKVWPGQVTDVLGVEPFTWYQIRLKSAVELSGFSGAPIIDSEGNVLAVLTGGGRTNEEGKNLELVAESLQHLSAKVPKITR